MDRFLQDAQRSDLSLITNCPGERSPAPREELSHPTQHRPIVRHISEEKEKSFHFWGVVGGSTACLLLVLLISAGVILLGLFPTARAGVTFWELFYTGNSLRPGQSCPKGREVFAECSAPSPALPLTLGHPGTQGSLSSRAKPMNSCPQRCPGQPETPHPCQFGEFVVSGMATSLKEVFAATSGTWGASLGVQISRGYSEK